MLLEAYKNWNIKDPFTSLSNNGFDVNIVLGSVAPLLLGYGIPANVLTIVALIFSDFVTYILLGFTFLKEAFTSESNIFGKINAGVWAVYLSIAGDNIHIPFFTMMLSLMTVVGYLIGNRYGNTLDMYTGWMKSENSVQTKKVKTIQKTNANSSYEEEIFKLDEQETSAIIGYKIIAAGWLYGDLKTFKKLGDCKKYVKIQILKPIIVKAGNVEYVNVRVIGSPQNKSLIGKEGWLVYNDTTFKRKWKKVMAHFNPPQSNVELTPSTPITAPNSSTSNPQPTNINTPITPNNTSTQIPATEKNPSFAILPPNQTKIKPGQSFELEWKIRDAGGLPFELRENGVIIHRGNWVDGQSFKHKVENKEPGTYQYEIRVIKPGHLFTNEPKLIVEP